LREAEAKLKAEAKAKLKAEAEAKLKAEAEAKRKAEAEAKLKAEAEAKLKAEAEARLKAEAEAKLKAEAEAKLKAEAVGLPIEVYEEYRNLDKNIFIYQTFESELVLSEQLKHAKKIRDIQQARELTMKIEAPASARKLRCPDLADVSASSCVAREELIESINKFISTHEDSVFDRYIASFLKFIMNIELLCSK
jgi:hypothetical protein